ncbi:MAG: DUF3306 domain-containing protein [Xanthobacteraceae bacterium]
MSEPENFIARWSRRKREATQEAEAPAQPATAPEAAAENAQTTERQPEQRPKEGDATVAGGGTPQPAFDPASLPSLDSITADSDIRAFLAPGVPPALARAALRRAWAADPGIRDFVGLADYDWDFVTPGAITGFGSLEMTDELCRHAARLVGRGLAGEEVDRPAPTSAALPAERSPVETSFESAGATAEVPTRTTQSNCGNFQGEADPADDERHNCEPASQRNKADTAAQHNPEKLDNDQVIAKRPHGSALPE